MSAIKFEAARIHFVSDVFVAVAMVAAGSPPGENKTRAI